MSISIVASGMESLLRIFFLFPNSHALAHGDKIIARFTASGKEKIYGKCCNSMSNLIGHISKYRSGFYNYRNSDHPMAIRLHTLQISSLFFLVISSTSLALLLAPSMRASSSISLLLTVAIASRFWSLVRELCAPYSALSD